MRQRVLATFDRKTFKDFARLTPGRVVWTFTHVWIGIAVALALGFWAWTAPGWLPKLLIPWLVLYLGTRHNAFAVQVHEAGHKLLFARARVNDAFCNFFGGYWVLNDVESYRRVHLVHHTDLHLDTDPDLDLYRLPKNGHRFEIAQTLLRDLLGFTALRRIVAYVRHPRSQAATVGGAPSRGEVGKSSHPCRDIDSIARLGARPAVLFRLLGHSALLGLPGDHPTAHRHGAFFS